jgi:hypothetical protein
MLSTCTNSTPNLTRTKHGLVFEIVSLGLHQTLVLPRGQIYQKKDIPDTEATITRKNRCVHCIYACKIRENLAPNSLAPISLWHHIRWRRRALIRLHPL